MAYTALQRSICQISRIFHRNKPEQTVKTKCCFNHSGCQFSFFDSRACKDHQKTCFYGLFTSCRNPECTVDNRLFSSPKQLLNHAYTEHGVEVRTSLDLQTLKIKLDKDFLFPGKTGYSSKVLRSYKITMQDMDATIPVYLVVKEDKIGDDANVLIIPILIIENFEQNQNQNHLIELKCQVTGRNGNPILSLSSPDQSKVTISVCKSHRDFFGNNSAYKCVSYSRQDIMQNGITDNETGSVTIEITTALKSFRCMKEGSFSFCSKPHATTWNDLFGIPEEIKKTMQDFDEIEPWCSTRTLLPPFLEEKKLIIETSIESYALNSIMTGTLCKINPCMDQNNPAFCQVLIIMPSNTCIDLHIKEWKMRASKCGITVCRLLHYHDKAIANLMFYGAQVIVTTPNVLASFMEKKRLDQDKNQLMHLITKELAHVHLHQPSFYIEYLYSGFLNDLIEIGNIPVSDMHLTVYDNIVSQELKQLIQYYFFKSQGEFISAGPNPKKMMKNNIFIRQPKFESKDDHIVRIIKNDQRGPRKWLILVQSTNEFTLYPLINILRENFNKRQITLVGSLNDVKNNPYLLESFVGRRDAIVIAPFETMQVEELQMAKGIIVYDNPDEATLVQIASKKTISHQDEQKLLIFRFAEK